MPTLSDILLGAVLPAGFSLVIMLLAWQPWSKDVRRAAWAAPLAIGIGFCIGFLGLTQTWRPPSLAPSSAEDAAFHLGWIAAVLGVLSSTGKPRSWPGVMLAILGSAGGMFWVGRRIMPSQLSTGQLATTLAVVGASAGVVCGCLNVAAARVRGVTVPLLLTITTGILSLYIVFNANLGFGQREGIVASTLLPIVLLATWSNRVSLAGGGVMTIVVLSCTMMACYYLYADDVVTWHLAMIAAAPVIGLLPCLLPLAGWKRLTACVLLTLLPLGYVMVPATQHLMADIKADYPGE